MLGEQLAGGETGELTSAPVAEKPANAAKVPYAVDALGTGRDLTSVCGYAPIIKRVFGALLPSWHRDATMQVRRAQFAAGELNLKLSAPALRALLEAVLRQHPNTKITWRESRVCMKPR
jgi:hypothetical protein